MLSNMGALKSKDFQDLLRNHAKKMTDFSTWDQKEMLKLNAQRFKLDQMEQQARKNREQAHVLLSNQLKKVLALFEQKEAAHKKEIAHMQKQLSEKTKEIEEVCSGHGHLCW